MNQYCRYCSHMFCGNGNYCEVNDCTFSDSVIKRINKCRYFDFLPIDALGENEKGYRPRKGRYIAEKPDKDFLDMIEEQIKKPGQNRCGKE